MLPEASHPKAGQIGLAGQVGLAEQIGLAGQIGLAFPWQHPVTRRIYSLGVINFFLASL
jgi:hypothetical protein